MPKPNYTYLNIKRRVGRAIERYQMIADGDRIAVGLSGGKDSLTLLWFLSERLKRIPISYELHAIYIDPGFNSECYKPLELFCNRIGCSFTVEQTDNGLVAHSSENRENPCFLCSHLRRKRLFTIANEMGCKTLALGHNKDDIIETLFLNMCFSGEMSTMKPLQSLFGGQLTIIRPLALTDEETIRKFAQQREFPILDNACPTEKVSQRNFMKRFLEQLYRHNRKIKGNLFKAMSHIKADYLLEP